MKAMQPTVNVSHHEDCALAIWRWQYKYISAPPRCPQGGPKHVAKKRAWAKENPSPECQCGLDALVEKLAGLGLVV